MEKKCRWIFGEKKTRRKEKLHGHNKKQAKYKTKTTKRSSESRRKIKRREKDEELKRLVRVFLFSFRMQLLPELDLHVQFPRPPRGAETGKRTTKIRLGEGKGRNCSEERQTGGQERERERESTRQAWRTGLNKSNLENKSIEKEIKREKKRRVNVDDNEHRCK